MSASRKGRGRKGKALRTYRQKISLDGAVIAGNRRQNHVVYGYRFPSHPGRMKIGFSTRGIDRVAEQSTAFPEKPELVFMIHDPDAKRLEKAFHMALSDRQSDVMGTEWFDVSWRDVLRVSPHLRRATGKGRGHPLRWMMTLILALVMAAAYPALAAACTGVINDIPLSAVAASAKAYGQDLWALDIPDAWAMARGMLSYGWGDQSTMIARGMPIAASLAPISLPWVLGRRRQAR